MSKQRFVITKTLLAQDVIWTSIQRLLQCYGRQMDVKTTLCAYEETFVRDSSTSVNTMTRVVMRRGF